MEYKFHAIPFLISFPKEVSNVGLKPSVTVIVINININSIFGEVKVDDRKLEIPISCLRVIGLKILNIIHFAIFCNGIDKIDW